MKEDKNDPIQHAAWIWVGREYDRPNFDEQSRAEMTSWLLADPRHRRAYERAARVWLLAGLVPPVNDLGDWDDQELAPEQL